MSNVPSGPGFAWLRMTPGRWPFTAYLGALSALPPLSIDMGLPGIPQIEAQLADASGRGALTLTVFLAGFALSPLACGPMADRYGRRATLVGGLLAFVLGAGSCMLAGTFPVLLLCRMVQGIAAGACVLMPLAIVRDVFEGQAARRHMSQITSVVGLAPMLAPVLGGWVLAISGWRLIYGAQAICGLLLLLVTVMAFSETLPVAGRRPLNPASIIQSYVLAVRDRLFRGNTLLYAFSFACMFSFISSAPAVLMGQMGLTPSAFSLVFGLTSGCTVLGSVTNGWLGGRHVASSTVSAWGTALLLAAGLVLAGVTWGSTTPSIVVVVLPVAAVMFCFGLIGPSANHDALRGLGAVAGVAAGLLRCSQMVMGALASLMVALLQPLGHPTPVMAMLMLAASLAAAAAVLWLRRGDQSPASSTSGDMR